MRPLYEDDAAQARRGLVTLNRFARPSVARSAWQVLSTAALFALSLAAIRGLSTSAARYTLVLPVAGLLVRLFVLQHDCGHHSFFRGRRPNDVLGTLLSVFTGISYEPWRTEHAWHHTHQAQLEVRGIDRVNSPMTVAEALSRPAEAAQRQRLIRVSTVFFVGVFSLLVKRKRLRGFFHFRPGYRWRIADERAQIRSHWLTLAGHLAVQIGFLAALGPRDWATVLLPAYVIAGGCGALLFWVQHNFERTYHASGADWSYHAAGLRGSSYLSLPPPLGWLTASIGLHHVHHLHPRIPNYRLDEARRAVPELAAIRPLTSGDLRRCFTHVFWDGDRARMVRLDELSS